DAEREMLRAAAPEVEKKQAAIDQDRAVLSVIDKKLQESNSSLAKLSLQIKELEKKLADKQDPDVKSKLEQVKNSHADQSRTRDEMVKEHQAGEKTLQAGEKAMADFLDQPRAAGKQSLRDWARRTLESFVNDPTILMQHSERWKELHAKAP